ncbi:hypothetical protein TWF281_006509 [Arthrobotrys megalospora]
MNGVREEDMVEEDGKGEVGVAGTDGAIQEESDELAKGDDMTTTMTLRPTFQKSDTGVPGNTNKLKTNTLTK